MTTLRVQPSPATTTFLRSVPVFGGLEGPRLAQLYTLLEEQSWKKGDHLFNEAELGRTMYVLREGEVDVVRRAASGNPVQIVTLGPGETFGEMTLVELQPRSASVIARSGAVTYSLTNLDLYRLYEKDSYAYTLILQNICRMLSRRLRKADSRIAEFLDAALEGEKEQVAALRSASKPHPSRPSKVSKKKSASKKRK